MQTGPNLLVDNESLVEVTLESLPALVVGWVQLLTGLLAPLSDSQLKGSFKHKCLCPLSHFDGFELPVSPVVKALRIRPVWGHHRMQGGSTRAEAPLFRLVLSKYEAHELCHTVPMIVRWPESFLCHRPPWWKNDKVCNCCSFFSAWVTVVKADAVHNTEVGKIVLVRSIVPMPGNNVKRRVVLFCLKKMPLIFGDDCEVSCPLFKPGGGGQEVPWIGKSVCSNWSQVGKDKMVVVNLENIASCWSFHNHAEPDALLDHANLVGFNLHPAKLGGDVEFALLGHQQHVPVAVVHRPVRHA